MMKRMGKLHHLAAIVYSGLTVYLVAVISLLLLGFGRVHQRRRER